MKELQGTEKQIVWAEEIRTSMIKMLGEKINELQVDKKATKSEVMRSREYFKEAKTVAEVRIAYVDILREVENSLLLKEDARWFISYKNMDCETLLMNYCGEMKEIVFSEVCK